MAIAECRHPRARFSGHEHIEIRAYKDGQLWSHLWGRKPSQYLHLDNEDDKATAIAKAKEFATERPDQEVRVEVVHYHDDRYAYGCFWSSKEAV